MHTTSKQKPSEQLLLVKVAEMFHNCQTTQSLFPLRPAAKWETAGSESTFTSLCVCMESFESYSVSLRSHSLSFCFPRSVSHLISEELLQHQVTATLDGSVKDNASGFRADGTFCVQMIFNLQTCTEIFD